MTWRGWEDYDPTGVGLAPRREGRIKGAQPVVVDGHLFPSQHEADRYGELRLEEQAETIRDLRLQFAFPLRVGECVIGQYRADFTYTRDGHPVVEDAKGFRTELYRWKRRHFEAQYGIRIQET